MSNDQNVPLPGSDVLSSRGKRALAPAPAYWMASVAARECAYHPKDNPKGIVDMSVAENRLSLPFVTRALNSVPPVPPSFMTYDDMHGSSRMRHAVAKLFSEHLIRKPVQPDHLAITAGAGSTIDLLSTFVCEEGDRVMITGPAYRGLENDVIGRARCELVVAELDASKGFPVTAEAFNRAWEKAGGPDSRIKLCLVCTPNNPTGEVLSAQTLRDIAAWGKERGIHVAFDEVYGMSCFSDEKFVSAAAALEDGLQDTTHIIWSFSKDFCLSGSRVGILYTRNTALLTAYSVLSYFCSTSRHTQWALLHMLEDEGWLAKYLTSNRERLHEAYTKCTAFFDDFGVPYLPSKGGFFVLANLSEWMESNTEEAEDRLWKELLEERVLLTPAAQMLSSNYGWFRVCFAASDLQAAEVAWIRMREALTRIGARKRRDAA